MAVSRNPISTENGLALNLKPDVASKLFLYDADVTPLLAFTEDLKKVRKVTQPKFQHLYSDQSALWSQVNNGAGYTDSATSIVVDDGTVYNVGDIIVNTATAEHLRVTGVSTNTLTVVRAFGSTAAAAMTDNDYLVVLGNAFGEGTTSPDPNMLIESSDYNFTQIFKKSVSVTGTAQASQFYVGPELKKRREQALRDTKRQGEYQALFGERYQDASTTNPIRTTAGLNAKITTNRFAIAGTLSQDYFAQTVLPAAGRYGSSKKVIYCGVNMLKCFTDWGLDRLQTFTSDTMLGFKAREYINPFLDLMIVRHKMLEGPYAGWAFIVDPENFYRAELPGRSLTLQTDIQENDRDGKKDQWFGEWGYDIPLEKSHAVLTGITGPA